MQQKVCFIATIAKTVEWFMLDQAKFLTDKGYDVSIICNEDPDFRKKLPDNIHYIPVSMKRGIDLSGIKSMLSMIRIFSSEKFDVIQYTTPNASMYASLAGKLSGIHNRIYRQWGMVYIGFTGAKRAVFEILERFTCALSTYVLPDSFGNLEFCRQKKFYGKKKSGVILNGSAAGLNSEKFNIDKKAEWKTEITQRYHIDNSSFVIGFVGRINQDKGINELLTAFQKFHTQHSESKLFLVGLADRENEIKPELLSWSKQSDSVFYTGVTTETEKFYSAFDIYTLPSYREGFGSTIIEAEGMGIPVVTTNIPGPSEAIIDGKTGILVPKQNADALYQAFEQLYTNEALRNELGQNGQKFARDHFSQTDLLNANLEFLRTLLKK